MPRVRARPDSPTPFTSSSAPESACFGCHSNETSWSWYANAAPVSWLLQRDVNEGRAALDFSESARGEADGAAEALAKGDMPPWFCQPLHADAPLSPAEKHELIDGFVATFGGDPAADGSAGEGE